jgi:hypothetical protein
MPKKAVTLVGKLVAKARSAAGLDAPSTRGTSLIDRLPIVPGEAWSDAALADLAKVPPDRQAAWAKLLAFCRTAKPSHPPKKYLRAAREHVEGIPEFATLVSRWLPLVDRPTTLPLPVPRDDWGRPDPNLLLSETNAQILKGLAWSCATVDDADVARALADCSTASFKKIRWQGPRCPKLGNACLDALALMPTPEAAAQLSRLSAVVKQPTGRKTVTKAIAHLAERTHQTPEDLEELAVPTYDMRDVGLLERPLGPYTARLSVAGPADVAVTYANAAGKTQKTVPADLKRDHPAELKVFQKTVKDLDKMLTAQRMRIERLLLTGRSWPLDPWRKRYVDHPLLAPLSRRLIWTFTHDKKTTTAIPVEGRLVDETGTPFTPPEGAEVRLWHPIGATVDLVRAWRTFLQDHQITQPFKQAHREIYVITDAELRTRTYSNRFAAHVIRQHQFRALCQHRGWKAGLIGSWDPGSDTTPTLELPQFQLRAQFWVEPTGTDFGDTGTVTYLSTDQVRFYRQGGDRPLNLADVPATVFSEVMRDVDLFVGVASVGNDPSWQDTGQAGFRDYWHATSFGDLSASAQTRHELLTTLLPKLRIAPRATLTEKFLIVRGTLRTYKIHLGSSNILMEPNDQYLCVVPDRRPAAAEPVFLPFEGDQTLTVILSKAFMLADDTAIKDPSITRQINAK